MVAVRGNQKPVVESLVNAGANINVELKNGMALLMIAIKDGHTDIAKYVIEQGANLAVESDDGLYALSLAKSKGMAEIVNIIKTVGEKVEYEKGQITGNISEPLRTVMLKQ